MRETSVSQKKVEQLGRTVNTLIEVFSHMIGDFPGLMPPPYQCG